ncbi:MAG: hypothetical protein KDA32_09565 [Phycisphaerales bacterium]|nr:hypothetical protein [Phycisphaerales bacterium]
MKSWLGAGVAVLLFAQAQVLAGGLLINSGLDDPPDHETDIATGWTLVEPSLDSNGIPANSATFASFANHNLGGTRGLWFRNFEGGLGGDEPFTVDAHLYQDVAGTPGDEYTASAWFRFETWYPGANPFSGTDDYLILDFLDGSNSSLGAVVVNADDSYPGNDSWFQVSATGTAPAGTVSVRVQASFIGGELQVNNPQSAFVDDFFLTPEPASALLLLVPLFALRRRG